MTLLEKYNKYSIHPKEYLPTPKENILFRFLDDLTERGSFGQAWDLTDDEDLEDCLDEWFKILT